MNYNKKIFLFGNLAFTLLHLATAIVQVLIVNTNRKQEELVPWSYMNDDKTLGIFLISLSIVVHGVAFLFHVVFCILSNYIVHTKIQEERTNPYRTVKDIFVYVPLVCLIIFMSGIKQFLVVLFGSLYIFLWCGLSYFQDWFIHRDMDFTPEFTPLVFTVISYLLFFGILSFINVEFVLTNKNGKIPFVNIAALFFIGVKLVIQISHTYINWVHEKRKVHDEGTQIEMDEEEGEDSKSDKEEEDEEEKKEREKEQLSQDVRKESRSIRHELYYSFTMFLSTSLISWTVVYITVNRLQLEL